LVISYSRVVSRIQISLAPKDCIKKNARLSRLDSLGFNVVLSINKGWFEDISQNLSRESSEEDVNGFFASLSVSTLSAEVLELCNILFNVQKSHPKHIEFHLGSLLFVRVLELISEFMYELISYVWDVISNRVESIDPDSYITYLSFNIRSFDKGEGDSDFSDGGIKSYNILVDLKVGFDFFNESIHFIPYSIKYLW
jgi:hypothetical protein